MRLGTDRLAAVLAQLSNYDRAQAQALRFATKCIPRAGHAFSEGDKEP